VGSGWQQTTGTGGVVAGQETVQPSFNFPENLSEVSLSSLSKQEKILLRKVEQQYLASELEYDAFLCVWRPKAGAYRSRCLRQQLLLMQYSSQL